MRGLVFAVLLTLMVAPVYAQSVIVKAQVEIEKDKEEQRVYEAKQLLHKEAIIRKELTKIAARLAELDAGAEPQTSHSGSISVSSMTSLVVQ